MSKGGVLSVSKGGVLSVSKGGVVVDMDMEQVIANRLWRIQWRRWRWGVENLHNRRRMFPGKGYRWVYERVD